MEYRQAYEQWLAQDIDDVTRRELESIADNEEEIKDRFYRSLSFGTAGMRGVLGAGSNRMNDYTVGLATQGLANVILAAGPQAPRRGVVIAYDSRRCSDTFAEVCAGILCANGIRVYLFESLRPTPELSFAIRHLNCIAGINITASHNPAAYNGYKVYWEDGGQMPPEQASAVQKEIDAITRFDRIRRMDVEVAKSAGLLTVVGASVDKAYLDLIHTVIMDPEVVAKAADMPIVYTPLHGAGNMLVRAALKQAGFTNVSVVAMQERPDGNFPTTRTPNPEEPEAMRLAIAQAKEEGAELVIGTDPDGDRMGVGVYAGEEGFKLLTGNQIGCLMLHYVLSARKRLGNLPENGAAIKSIVSTEMARAICADFGVEMMDVLTGFKFIAEKIEQFDRTHSHTFLFGFEESFGFLAGTFVRDKDAVMACQLLCETAAWYRERGMTLYDGLQQLYQTYGYYSEKVLSITAPGAAGQQKIADIMALLRSHKLKQIGDTKVVAIRDYLKGKRYVGRKAEALDMPASDVYYYETEGGFLVVRPSGTEPKVKIYAAAKGATREEAVAAAETLLAEMQKILQPVLDA